MNLKNNINKNKKIRKQFLICLVFVLFSTLCYTGCSEKRNDDIIILFTNDVHCGVEEGIGYAGLSHYKKEMQKYSKYVTLVDCGDFSNGDCLGAISSGEYPIEIMNEVGYDIVTLGNHEFDFGMAKLKSNIDKLNAKVICSNFSYTGCKENLFSDILPYEIVSYGEVDVAFIGVATPVSTTTSTPNNFKEDGVYVYDFCNDGTGEKLYETIQKNVDECLENGVDYVVLLSHLGIEGENEVYLSTELAKNTTGIDVILDGHSHSKISCDYIKNKNGKDVLLTSTGTKLESIGKLIISDNGLISTSYISGYEEKDANIIDLVSSKKAQYKEKLEEIIGSANVTLASSDEFGIRMTRSTETTIGNFIADAYRHAGESDIAMINGGGIRSDIKEGNVTYSDVIAVNPYGNMLCVFKIKGSKLLEMCEYFYRATLKEYSQNGKAVGEDGSFQHLSGLKITIDTSIPTSIVKDENDMLISVGETRRVSEAYVLENGEYVPLDKDKIYTVTSHNYMVKNGGSGMEKYLKDVEIIVDEFIPDYQALIEYLNYLNGDLSKYSKTEGRITIK